MRRAERPQANDWFRFLQRPHEYFDYRSAKKRCDECLHPVAMLESYILVQVLQVFMVVHHLPFVQNCADMRIAQDMHLAQNTPLSLFSSMLFRSSFPDFRHQHNSWDALWLEDAPQWVAEAVLALDMAADRADKVQL